MKKNHGLFFGFTVLALAAMFVLAGCSSPTGGGGGNGNGNGDSSNPFVGTWTGDSGTLTVTDSSWELEEFGKGTYTPTGSTAVLTATHSWQNGWVQNEPYYTLDATVSGNTLSVTYSGQNLTFTQGSGGGGGETSVPSAPTGVTATAQSSSSISVSWDQVSGATSYEVYYEIGSSTTKNLAGTVSGTSYTHTGLQASTTYYYYIKAVNSAGSSDYSSDDFATTSSSGGGGETSAPSVPTGVTATALTSTSIRISWNTVPGATSYKIYSPNGPGSSSNFVLLDTATTNSYTDDDSPEAGETWYYKVSAVNSIGESAQSASVSAKTPNPLSAPTNVVAAHADYSSRLNTSRNSIKITWNAVSGAVNYNVYEYVSYLGGYWDKVGYNVTGTEWTHTGLQPDTAHSYYVKAVDSGGTEGAASTTGGNAMGRTAK
jgi:fibronectin type 3 domain-containing protein